MKLTRRTLLKTMGAVPLVSLGKFARADQYPSRPIRIIVPASISTSIDVTARFFADHLARNLNTSVVVENRPGTGGLLAYSAAAKTEPDGYTIAIAGIPMYLLPLLSQGTATFDPMQDFTPVTRVARVSNGVVVSADSPYRSFQDLVQAMKDKPGQLTYSSQGVGSSAHLFTVVLNHSTETQAQHVPYRETTMAITDVVGGRIDFTVQSPPATKSLIDAGKLRLLAVTGDKRWAPFPDVPTIAETGVPGFEISSWLDFIAPKGTPEVALAILTQELSKIAAMPEYEQFCQNQIIAREIVGYEVLAAEMAEEAAKWKRIAELSKA